MTGEHQPPGSPGEIDPDAAASAVSPAEPLAHPLRDPHALQLSTEHWSLLTAQSLAAALAAFLTAFGLAGYLAMRTALAFANSKDGMFPTPD